MTVIDFSNLTVGEDATLMEAMKRLDQSARKLLAVTRDGVLLATLTDGDIRRWLLKQGDLSARVSQMANYRPRTVRQDDVGTPKALELVREFGAVPVVDENNRLLGVIFRDGVEVPLYKSDLDVPVVINAGGRGTRLYPYTKVLPKPLIPIGELPIAEIIINRFAKMGCSDFHMIVNHKRNMIKSYFSENEHDYSLDFIDEYEPLGTGGGLSLLKGKLDGAFIFSNCDTIINTDFNDIVKTHRERGNSVTMICALKNYEVPYGVVEAGEGGALLGFREKPKMTFFTNTGCYIVESYVVERMKTGERVGFPTIVEREKAMGNRVSIYPVSEYTWLDMGQLDSMEQMRERLGVD